MALWKCGKKVGKIISEVFFLKFNLEISIFYIKSSHCAYSVLAKNIVWSHVVFVALVRTSRLCLCE